jgi:hypothetical protein
MELPLQAIWFTILVGALHAWSALERARERELCAAQLEGSLARAQIRNLRLQLQPHFLFNALNTISATMYDDPRAADERPGLPVEAVRPLPLHAPSGTRAPAARGKPGRRPGDRRPSRADRAPARCGAAGARPPAPAPRRARRRSRGSAAAPRRRGDRPHRSRRQLPAPDDRRGDLPPPRHPLRARGRLDPARFLRLNRSTIVRLDALCEVQPWFHGDARVVLKDGSVLTWSRRYRAKAEGRF